MENTECHICQRGHVGIHCPYEATRDNLRRLYREGLHNLAEMTANRLGLELNVSEKSLLERLTEPEEGREETPADLPLVGPWDPEFLEGHRASPDTTEERVTDDFTNPPTLLEGSNGTISHGTAFEYWSRRIGARNTREVAQEQSDQFQNMVSTYQSKTTAIAFPVDSQNIATVREAAASDGFRSIIIEPTSPADLPLIVIGRHAAALEQFTEPLLKARVNRGFWASNAHKVVHTPYLVPFFVAIILMAATWYYRRL